MFKHRTLAHLEPTITRNKNCHISIDSLEEIAERFCDDEDEEGEENEDEDEED